MDIKAGSIQNLTDGRYFASHNVEWIGFCFDPDSPRFIPPREAQQIKAWLEGPGVIGEFGAQSWKEILETAMILGLQGIQIDAEHFPAERQNTDLALIARITVAEFDSYEDVKSLIPQYAQLQYLLLDLTFHFDSWDQFISESLLGLNGISQLAAEYPVMLAAQFNAGNILDIVNKIKPVAIQLSGAAEEKTGEKLFDELDGVFALL